MSLLAWSESYSVHVAQFDQHHQELFRMVNGLHDAMVKGHGKDIVSEVLRRLVSYTENHFAAEERTMKQCGYPGLATHKVEHELLTTQVKKFVEDYNAGRVSLSVPLLNFLRDWLTKHIAASDQKYSSYLNSKGIH